MSTPVKVDRRQWVRALTAHPPEVLIELAEKISQGWKISYEALPQTGLSLLQLQDSVLHQPYYLGEIPLSVAWVQLEDQDGKTWQGAAQVMSDYPNLATALAICDAILANQLTGWEEVAHFVEQGQALRQQEERLRGAMLAKTRVDFSVLSQEVDDAFG